MGCYSYYDQKFSWSISASLKPFKAVELNGIVCAARFLMEVVPWTRNSPKDFRSERELLQALWPSGVLSSSKGLWDKSNKGLPRTCIPEWKAKFRCLWCQYHAWRQLSEVNICFHIYLRCPWMKTRINAAETEMWGGSSTKGMIDLTPHCHWNWEDPFLFPVFLFPLCSPGLSCTSCSIYGTLFESIDLLSSWSTRPAKI